MRSPSSPRSSTSPRALLRTFAALLLTAFVVAAPAFPAATSTPAELGSDGTIYRLWTGTFAEVFGPNNHAVPAEMPVLALDIVPPGQPLLRYLVPGTEGPATEGYAALLFDRSSSAVHIVWNSRTVANQTISRLNLRSLTPTGWSDLIELSGGSLSDKSALRLVLTADNFASTAALNDTRTERRILHLAWSENIAGVPHSYYSPVVFVNGRYLGWNPVLALDDLAPAETASAVAVPAELRGAPSLVATASGKISASFVHAQSNRLVSVEIEALPGEIGELAEMARGHIVELAGTLPIGDRAQLGAMARGHIVELARNFHAAAANYIADKTGELLASADPAIDTPTLAEMARGHIVELGREILSTGLANRCANSEDLLEIPPLDPLAFGDTLAFSQFLALRKVTSWEMPADLPAASAATARILVSADGSRATIAWQDESRLVYRETDAAGVWSAERILDLMRIPLADAWGAIERRASGL